MAENLVVVKAVYSVVLKAEHWAGKMGAMKVAKTAATMAVMMVEQKVALSAAKKVGNSALRSVVMTADTMADL